MKMTLQLCCSSSAGLSLNSCLAVAPYHPVADGMCFKCLERLGERQNQAGFADLGATGGAHLVGGLRIPPLALGVRAHDRGAEAEAGIFLGQADLVVAVAEVAVVLHRLVTDVKTECQLVRHFKVGCQIEVARTARGVVR